jgi:curved DNA-binding protein CbpA
MPRKANSDGQELYKRLGVSPTASREQIVAAYRRRSLLTHPDTSPDDAEAAVRFRQLTEAYETLADGRRRALYDREQAQGLMSRVEPSVSSNVTIRLAEVAEREDAPLRAGPVHIEPADGWGPFTNRAMPWYTARLIDDWVQP